MMNYTVEELGHMNLMAGQHLNGWDITVNDDYKYVVENGEEGHTVETLEEVAEIIND